MTTGSRRSSIRTFVSRERISLVHGMAAQDSTVGLGRNLQERFVSSNPSVKNMSALSSWLVSARNIIGWTIHRGSMLR